MPIEPLTAAADPASVVWHCIAFDQLTLRQLYDLGRLRQEVFVVDQNAVYLDFDGKDLHCSHILGYHPEGQLLAHARIIPPGIAFPNDSSIGRVVTHLSARGTGLGRRLMDYAMQECLRLHPGIPIRIESQSYLVRFYQSYGFERTEKPDYILDSILHTEMLWSPA